MPNKWKQVLYNDADWWIGISLGAALLYYSANFAKENKPKRMTLINPFSSRKILSEEKGFDLSNQWFFSPKDFVLNIDNIDVVVSTYDTKIPMYHGIELLNKTISNNKKLVFVDSNHTIDDINTQIELSDVLTENESSNGGNDNSKDVYDAIYFLENNFTNIEVIVFSDDGIENKSYRNIVTPQMTKYRRIKLLLKEAEYNNILCFDNDIIMDKENIIKFIMDCTNRNYSIAWGKVKARKIKGFVPKLINIDKNLSHNFVRPFLWDVKLGISLPGQIFMINKQYFLINLPDIDTVYDDLMIGAVVREYNLPIYFAKDILGYERPKENFLLLIKQRIRWAKGLAETIYLNKKNKVLPYILLHAFSFNLLWIPIYILIYSLLRMNILYGVLTILAIAYALTDNKVKDISWSFMYMIIFPFIYVVWGIALLYNLIRIPLKSKFK